jgi:CheY-like chemotaxis protein
VWVDEVARDVATIAERTLDARIQVTADLDCPRAIVGDRAQVEQVVMNLVMNARDAMPDGGQLALRTRSEGDMVVLEVVDTGHGVPEELRDRIFEPYFSTRSRDGQRGAGLGLATVYGIVEAHRGTLDVRDNPAGGTIVRVAIPAAAPNVQRETAVVQETEAVTSVTSDAGLVMVVEDEPAIRRATSNALELLGYDVVCAEDGVQAVAIFEARHAELCGVVLDLAMPRLDGRRTYETMRAIDAEVPVLLTSGYAQEGEVQSVLDLGVKAFLPKPYDARTLAAALSRVVRGRREAVARP